MYICIDPRGKRYTVEDLPLFCKANELSYSAMVNLANNWQTEYKGWQCRYFLETER